MQAMKDAGRLEPYLAWLTFAVFRGGEVLIAGMFWGALPNWMVITWWAIVAVSGSCADLLTDTLFPKGPGVAAPVWPFWFNAVCFGTAAFFLYVPGNLGYQGVLNVSLLCVAALMALQSVGGAPRLVAAVVLVPTSLRYLAEGDRIHILLGLGGIMISAGLAAVAHQAKQMLEEQRRLRERAERAVEAVASVNLAKARFFAAASHDLRQPVHAIGLYAEFLRGLQVQQPQQRQALEGIRQAWHSLDKLLGEVLDLTKLDANAMQPQFQSVDVSALLRDVAQQHAAAAQNRQIALVVIGGDRLRYVRADPLMLQRAVANVLTNAIKFSPEGSRIAMLSRRSRLDGRDAWRIQIRDAGPGIAESEQERIFDEFIQTQNTARQSAQGFGLGLAIVKRFCAVMGGAIQVHSRPGRGTTMNIILASAPVGEVAVRDPEMVAPAASLTRIGAGDDQILLVEDDPHVAGGMSLLMNEWGFNVCHAESAVEALQLEHQATLALCDVRMPGEMSGIDLAIELRTRGMRVMLMSGETESALREQARAESLTLLVKPVAPAALHDALKTLWMQDGQG
ncbi:hybrid sensor histidine kinase/response regulator [Diaphorobacter aerolatus]|uniref:histidine kinase n=1 Tax=Diaphorobacter aerolatus TaxID=1288495 RepID=A0A7H0GLI2_9BURK|nr:hybrid sensor histidine kinase/response regulator [Diaphorobacter aerolatus]QNP49148.1 response regulator [Diaphorobacter aerolatus]